MALKSLSSGAHPAATFPNSHLLRPSSPVLSASKSPSVQGVTFPNSHLLRPNSPVLSASKSPSVQGVGGGAWAAPQTGTALAELREAVRDEDWAKNYSERLTKLHMHSGWSASDERCNLLKWLASSICAQRALEVGSFCGVGTLALAEAMPAADAQVLALELDPFVVNLGKRFQMKAACSHKIQHLVGPAKTSLEHLAAEAHAGRLQPFDIVVVDADKESLGEYFDLLWNSPGLLSKSAVVCLDMTPFKGQPPLRFVRFGFPYQCETHSGQEEIDALRTSVESSSSFSSHEYGGMMIVQRAT